MEIQHNTSALHNVIRSAIRLRAPEKKSCCMCHMFIFLARLCNRKQ